jgi:hypothetical protein
VTEQLDDHTLKSYVHDVAAELGLGGADVFCETGEHPYAEVRFAGRAPDRPARDELLCWDPFKGWTIAVADGPSGSLGVVATRPEQLRPAPRVIAEFVRSVVASRGERLVHRPNTHDDLTDLLNRPFPPARAD